MADTVAVARRGAVDPSVYAMTAERAAAYGFVSYYNHTGSAATDRLANDVTLTREQMWRLVTNPFSLHVELGGWGGAGCDLAAVLTLLPCMLWAAVFLVVRLFCQRLLFRLGLYLQVVVPGRPKAGGTAGQPPQQLTRVQRNKLHKFQNQLWLFFFYSASAAFGYAVQRDEPWFGLPPTDANYVHFLTPHPYSPGPTLLHYYQYGLGFYLSEMITLIVVDRHMKRTDYIEYALHHVVTVFLMVFSHCSYDHRIGVYVLFIHDVSDIMLALSKTLNYVVEANKAQCPASAHGTENNAAPPLRRPLPFFLRLLFNENVVNVCFVAFIAGFVFFRLVCLPFLGVATWYFVMKIRRFTPCFAVLNVLLYVILQGLHIYWSFLIAKMVVRVFNVSRSDLRSEEDDVVQDTSREKAD